MDKTHFVLKEPPFILKLRIYGSFEISAYVVLKEDWVWDHPNAQCVPHETQRRMLPLVWSLVLGDGGAQKDFTARAVKPRPQH